MPSLRHMPPAHIEPRIAPKLVNAMARCGWHFCGRQLFFFGMGPSLLLFMIGLGMVDSLIPVIMLVLDYIRLLDVIKLWVFIYRGLVVPRQFIYSIYTSNIVTSRYNFFISTNQYNGECRTLRNGHMGGTDGAPGTQEHAHRGAHIVQLEFAKGTWTQRWAKVEVGEGDGS